MKKWLWLSLLAFSAASANEDVLVGADKEWLFYAPEVRAMTVGPFWGEDAVKVSRASKPDYADPLPAILDFHEQLKKADIALLLVPVPAKAAIYPEKSGKVSGDRPDPNHAAFYKLLQEKGVPVLDLHEAFKASKEQTYCKTDTHWSAAGAALAAKLIHDRTKDLAFLQETKPKPYGTVEREVSFTGDLTMMLEKKDKETLSMTFVGTKAGTGVSPIEPDRESPILLTGDSHTLVFHDPSLLAQGAGLPDHLALHFGMPLDLEGTRGSGATATRIALLRRRDNLAGKKLVIWCFSMREFTESRTGWRQVPVIR